MMRGLHRLEEAFAEAEQDAEQSSIRRWDVIYALGLAVGSLCSYLAMTLMLARLVGRDDDRLGGMWAVAATVFVFRAFGSVGAEAALDRMIATLVSFGLCLLYLLVFPSSAVGIAVVIGAGALVLALIGRRDEHVTTGITTAVVMVVAEFAPATAWQEPLLRLADTVVGVLVGMAAKWAALRVYFLVTPPARRSARVPRPPGLA